LKARPACVRRSLTCWRRLADLAVQNVDLLVAPGVLIPNLARQLHFPEVHHEEPSS
jgi:hypothetical protein